MMADEVLDESNTYVFLQHLSFTTADVGSEDDCQCTVLNIQFGDSR